MENFEAKLNRFAAKASEPLKAKEPEKTGGCRPRFPHVEPSSATCPECKEAWSSSVKGWRICPKCKGEQCLRRFAQICPTSYFETELDRLPSAQWKTVSQWKPGGKGLLLTGESRTGKTRCAWMLIKKLSEAGLRVTPFSPIGFSSELVDSQVNGRGKAFLDRVCGAELVFFDDLGKAKLTENVEASLFEVIEMRTAWKRPTIVTTNDTGESLKARMSDNRGAPLVERIKEFFQVVEF